MLDTTNKEVLEITRQIDNCYDLQRIIQRKIDENHPEWCLDGEISECGTYACVAGDYYIDVMDGDTEISHMHLAIDIHENVTLKSDFLFGGYEDYFFKSRVFGTSEYGGLKNRLEYINTHISTLEQKRASMLSGVK